MGPGALAAVQAVRVRPGGLRPLGDPSLAVAPAGARPHAAGGRAPSCGR
jgi:hypothetical protein